MGASLLGCLRLLRTFGLGKLFSPCIRTAPPPGPDAPNIALRGKGGGKGGTGGMFGRGLGVSGSKVEADLKVNFRLLSFRY